MQGPVTQTNTIDVVRHYQKIFGPKNVVVSQWDSDPIIDVPARKVLNKSNYYEEFQTFKLLNNTNRVNQAYTTFHGVKYLLDNGSYDLIIKTRTDEYYEDLEPLIDQAANDLSKIHCGNVFFRKTFPWHIGDHIYIGTPELIDEFVSVQYDFYMHLLRDYNACYEEFTTNNERWRKAVYRSREPFVLHPLTPRYMPVESVMVLLFLWRRKPNLTIADFPQLFKQYFDVYDTLKSKRGYVACNTSRFSRISFDDLLDISGMLKRTGHWCESCPKKLLCATRKQFYRLLFILSDRINSMDELVPLTHDWTTYLAYTACEMLHPDTYSLIDCT